MSQDGVGAENQDHSVGRNQEDSAAKKGLSRRQILAAGAAAGAAAAIPGGQAGIAAAAGTGSGTGPDPLLSGPPDLILYNGRIHTMDATNTVASFVAIRNGRFAEV